MLEDSSIAKDINIRNALNFRLHISKFLAVITCLFIIPYIIFYTYKEQYWLAAFLAIDVAFFLFKCYRSIQGKLDPIFTFVTLLSLLLITFYITAINYGIIAFIWVFPTLFVLYFMLTEHLAWLANIILLPFVFFVGYQVLDPLIAFRFVVTLTLSSVFLVTIIRVITQQHKLLQKEALVDSLTGVYNRVILEDQLDMYIQQSKRNHSPMTIATIDIDHFKKINDQHGHDKGDEALKAVASIISSRMRRSDMVFRIGGEEFLIFLYDTSIDQAYKIAEYLRKQISECDILPAQVVTVSMGLAEYQEKESLQSWIRRSDESLYEAKQNGRNQVIVNNYNKAKSNS